MPLNIWVPPSADEKPRFQCRICNDAFVTDDAYVTHVLKCQRVHENELHEFVEWHNEEHAMPDPEWEAYNRALRQKGLDPMVQFGRRKGMKPLRES